MEPENDKSADSAHGFDTSRYLALDTEFVWRSTYSAKMGLVQAKGAALRLPASALIAFDSAETRHRDITLIDPLVYDGAEIACAVTDRSIVKIFHAADQDLTYITRWCGAKFSNIFDTSLAARFCGYTGQISLQKLLADTLGVTLEKDSTLTDWLKRPLTRKQLSYALDDVAYLAELADLLAEKARSAGTLAWLLEATREAEAEAQAPEPEGMAWKRVKHVRAPLFRSPRQLVMLRELAETRERLAARADLPRNWVLDDSVLIAAALNPSGFDWQKASGNIPKNLLPELLEAYGRAAGMPPENLPRLEPAFAPAPKNKIEKAQSLVAECARRHGVDPSLIGTRTLCSTYAVNPDDPAHKFNKGWRRKILGI